MKRLISYYQKKLRGVSLFIKKNANIDEISGVRFINGEVSFSSVKLNVHCFEVDGVLIDSGSETLLPQFKEFFNQADVDKVILTHDHEDHVGGASYMQEKYNLPVFMHEMSAESSVKKATYPLYRQIFWGKRKPFEAQPLGDTFQSRNAEWDVIKTPGHTKDHLSFLNKDTRQLFSGDLYVNPSIKVVLRKESMPSIMQSIERVLTYDFDEVFCCHAGYVEDGRQALTNKLDNLKVLQERILSLHHQGYNNKEIQRTIYPKTYPITYFSLGEWDTMHVINSFVNESAH